MVTFTDAPMPETLNRPAFNEPKLRALIERANQLGLVRVDISARLQAVRSELNRLRSRVASDEMSRGAAHPDMIRRRDLAQQEVTRLLAEQQALDARAESVVGVAQRCRQWAESLGWREDGNTGSASLPPAVLNAAEG